MEPTLTYRRPDFQKRVGSYLGYETDPLRWSAKQLEVINDCVESGQRVFYRPALDGEAYYEWSFLKPLGRFTLASGAAQVVLPGDFAGFASTSLHILTPADQWVCDIPLGGRVRYMQAQSGSDRTGPPRFAQEEVFRGPSATDSGRYRLIVWPTADQAYVLEGYYHVNPDAMTDTRPFPYGGAEHTETMLEACLHIAETRYDDRGENHTALFKERLRASIMSDRRHRPKLLGYNADRSSSRYRRGWTRGLDDPTTVTLDGQTPE